MIRTETSDALGSTIKCITKGKSSAVVHNFDRLIFHYFLQLIFRLTPLTSAAKPILSYSACPWDGKTFQSCFLFFFQDSKRSSDYFQSRTDGNVITIFKKEDFLKPGDYAIVKVKESNSLTLKADLISKSSILEFSNFTPNNNIIEIDQKCLNSMQ